MRLQATIAATALALGVSASAEPLRYAEDRAPAIVHPAYATTMGEARLNELVFDGLFTDDLELRSTPLLAESFELAEDRGSMVMTLASDVQWHDGEPLKADDVVFTIEAMKNPASASTEAGRVTWIQSAEALDDQHVKLVFESEEYAPEDKLHFKILPAHRFDGDALSRTDPFRTKPIGTGPYQLASFNDDNSISMSRSPGYHRGEAELPEITMREVADKNYQAKLLIYQSLEALVRVLPRDLATLKNERRVELYPYQTNSWWYLGFNLQQDRFQDADVRRAVRSMVDVQGLLDPVGTGDILSGPFVKSSPFYNHDVPVASPDPNEVRSLLEGAGYSYDGRYWTKDGIALSLRVAAHQNLETSQEVVINLQSQLSSQGIQVDVDFLGDAEWKRRIWAERDFDVILSQWSFDRNEDIYEQFHSAGTRNFVSYQNPEVDALLDEARTAADPQQKKAALRKVHALVAADAPMVFLWTLDSYSALSTKVRNVVVHPFYFFTWAEDWSLR